MKGMSALLLMGTLVTLPVASETAPAHVTRHGPPDAVLVKSALSALPMGLRKGATVVAPDGKGGMRTLKQGTNGWTCMPDDPGTPGPDPMCADKASMAWLDALMKHAAPPAGHVGLMYMLAGGSDASNTDPSVSKPADGKWVTTGPHVMIAGTDQAFLDQYPKGAHPDTSVPYVMWAGTAYAHLMVPTK